MKQTMIVCGLLGVGLVGALLPNALGAEKEKPSATVAARVTETIKSKFPDAVITQMGKESEDGLSFIGVDFTLNGAKVEADVMEDGTLVGTEVAGDINTFPKPAAKALKKATNGMTVKETEIATTYAKADPNDKTGMKAVTLAQPKIAYEMAVEKDGKKGEFAVDADGNILESPKWASHSKAEGEKKEKEGKD
jgi:hypothetical protein